MNAGTTKDVITRSNDGVQGNFTANTTRQDVVCVTLFVFPTGWRHVGGGGGGRWCGGGSGGGTTNRTHDHVKYQSNESLVKQNKKSRE